MTTSEPHSAYFAIQILPDEQAHVVAKLVLSTAKGLGILFRSLEVLDTISLGTHLYARMRADLESALQIVERLEKQSPRGVVFENQGQYVVRMPNGRSGKVPYITMHAIAKLGQTRAYRGTKIKRWEQQFEAA